MFVCMPKRVQINFRVKPELKDDLVAIAAWHGLDVTSYIHSLIVKAIRREKEENPEAFPSPKREKLAPVIARFEEPIRLPSEEESREEIQRSLEILDGMPLAPRTKHPTPVKLDTTNTKAKRRNTR